MTTERKKPKAEYLVIATRLIELRTDRGLNQGEAAAALTIKDRTYQNYEYGISKPNTENLKKIIDYYECSYIWLLDGKGVKYPKAGGPEPYTELASAKEAPAPYATAREGLINPAIAHAQEFSIAEDLILAESVLKSRTHYATALHLNIRSFVGGVAAETTVSRCQDDLRVQGELIAQLQARLDGMDKQNSKLREEMEKLKKTRGDFPPIALEMDHAARTGTDDPEI